MKSKERLAYIEIILAFFIPILFLTAHYLHTISTLTENDVWMGMDVGNLWTDLTLYLAISLTIILLILILHSNFKIITKRR